MSSKSFDEVRLRFENIDIPESFDMIVAIANGGIIPAAMLNQRLDIGIQLLKIRLRDVNQKQLYDQPYLMEEICFDVKDKRVLLVEDRVKTGTTLNFARQLLLDVGALSVKTFAVNGNADYCLYNEMCFRFPWRID